MTAKMNEEKEIRLHLMLQAEKAEKAELMKTVTSLQAIVEGLQKQLAEAQQARLSAEAEAKKERDALLAEIRDLGKQLRQELCWQRGQQQQAQPGPSVTAAVTLPASQVPTGEDIRQVEQPSFAEVVRRKYRGMAKGKPRQPPQQQQQQEHQQQQQQQQQQRQPQRQAVAGTQQQQQRRQQQQQQQQHQQRPTAVQAQRSEQLRQERQRPARPRQDQLIFEPAEGCSYKALFEKIRLNPRLADENKGVKQGYRTSRDSLRLSLNQDADAAVLLQRIQEEVGDLATGRIITEMAEVMITGIDMLATKEDVERGLQRALERTVVAATTSLWERRDGTQRARVRLPRRDADLLADKRILVGYSACLVRSAPKQQRSAVRCFRCLERGHTTADCAGVDRSGLCLRCGATDHRAASCTCDPKCIVCGGPHRIAAPMCPGPQPQC